MSQFIEGEFVTALFFRDEQAIRVGVAGCVAIKVSMENGQMAGVPWFEVYGDNDEIKTKWNGALLEGIEK